MTSSAIRTVEQSLAAAADVAGRPLVLAVSGGTDSMALLEAAARVACERVAVVATFDHGSGRHATAAAGLVCRESTSRMLPVVVGRGDVRGRSEAAWRDARWRFLREVAQGVGGVVVTAHTEDDQVETVLMRAMRGSGARGLAALYAPSAGVLRPFLGLRRAALARYVAARGVTSFDDPTNDDRRYFRNRVRHELLPELLRVRPRLGRDLVRLARRAAALRAEVDAVADTVVMAASHGEPAGISVAADLSKYDEASLGILWPAVAGRAGLALDRRGTDRLVRFTKIDGRAGASMQLAGGWEVVRDRRRFTLRRVRGPTPAPMDLPVSGEVRWGRWSFARGEPRLATDPWRAVLPPGLPLVVRAWRPGDRMVGPAGTRRRVKRFFGDRGIAGPDRAGWPVVLAGEEIVWIPGVGRTAAAAGSPGTSGLVYSCELNHG